MQLLTTSGWDEYKLLDTGNGKRLERFGKYILTRPDPQIIWKPGLAESEWKKADAVFEKVNSKEQWVLQSRIPIKWEMGYKDLKFYAKLSPFKHTGVFPEQHLMWDWLSSVIASRAKQSQDNKIATTSLKSRNDKPMNILNLFAYTGISSLVCAKAGASVTHVDASYPTIGWGRENQALSSLSDKPIRWILDDCVKFVQREIKRGVKYDGIIMDPPVYGHGPKGEVWDFPKSFPILLELCKKVLSEEPLFILINAYAISASSLMFENVLKDMTEGFGGIVESGELVLQEKSAGRLLSTGIYGRWSFS